MRLINKVYGICLVLVCLFTGVAHGGDLEKGMEALGNQDYATALRELRPLAEQGNAEAQSNLGVMYDKGKGVTQDYREAVKWFHKAAEQGYADAQLILGAMYFEGNGVAQNFIHAHIWSNMAAANGSQHAVDLRQRIANEMTTADVAEAQRLARECEAREYRDC